SSVLRLQFVSGGLVFSSYLLDRWSSSAVLRLLRLFVCSSSSSCFSFSSVRLQFVFNSSSSLVRLFFVCSSGGGSSSSIRRNSSWTQELEEGNCSGEISAQINSNSTPHRNCSGSSGIRRRDEKNLLRICRAFSGVGAAQFPWVKIFGESTLAKITEDT
ncbi:LOW QUALITY PROTEIN: hypothetical protein V2J09_015114, partial [Rumex salicifolius]